MLSSENKGVTSEGPDDVGVSQGLSATEEEGEEFYSDEIESEEESEEEGRSEDLSSDEESPVAGPSGRVMGPRVLNLRKATSGIQRTEPKATTMLAEHTVLEEKPTHISNDRGKDAPNSHDSARLRPPSKRKSDEDHIQSESEDNNVPPIASNAPTVQHPNRVPSGPKANESDDTTSSEESTSTSVVATSQAPRSQNHAATQPSNALVAAHNPPPNAIKRRSWNPFSTKKALTTQELDDKIERHRVRADNALQRSSDARTKRTQNNLLLHNSSVPFGAKFIAFFARIGNWSSERRATRKWEAEKKKVDRNREKRLVLTHQAPASTAPQNANPPN